MENRRTPAEADDAKPPARRFLNFRPALFSAFGICFGVFLYTKIRFGGASGMDLALLFVFLPLSLFPLSKKRVAAAVVIFLSFALAGTLGIHLCAERFLTGAKSGVYEAEGTVAAVSAGQGYETAELTDVLLGGTAVDGRLSAVFAGEDLRAGDRVRFTAAVSRTELSADADGSYNFVNDIRYAARAETYEELDRGFHPMLALNGSVYGALRKGMGGEEADLCYALLTGNSRAVDDGLLSAVRAGGIAHMFAVSGLHIGILYGAVRLVCFPLKRYAAAPALAVSLFYCAFCGFTVSSVRALIMCGVSSVNVFLGRKTDFLSSQCFAATLVLLFMPAQWLSAGFRLSFGACLGLALFSGSLSRGMRRLRVPRFAANYLSAGLSVQFFTFPILLETFGYFPLWGILLNFIFIPLLPAAFLTLLLFTLLSLAIPPAAAFFLLFPKGIFAALLYLFSLADFAVLTGFSLGAGAAAFSLLCFFLTERVRLKRAARGAACLLCALLVFACAIAENCVFAGCTVDVWADGDGALVLFKTPTAVVLVLGGEVSERECSSFLSRRALCPDAAVVLSQDMARGANRAAFSGAERIYVREPVTTGFRETAVAAGEGFSVGGVGFRYETDLCLTVYAETCVISVCLTETDAGADLVVGNAAGRLKFYLNGGIIVSL